MDFTSVAVNCASCAMPQGSTPQGLRNPTNTKRKNEREPRERTSKRESRQQRESRERGSARGFHGHYYRNGVMCVRFPETFLDEGLELF